MIQQSTLLACVHAQSLSHVWLFATPWTVLGILQARILEWLAISSSKGSSPPRDRTCISRGSCIGRWILLFFTAWATWEAPLFWFFFFFNFIFKLYIIVLVLLNIKMNPPQVCMCSPSWTLLPPPSPYHPSGSSQCTSPKHPVSWRTKSRTLKRYINVHCNIIHNSQEVEEIYVFLSRLMHKQNCHIHTMECYSAFKRREILTYHAI